MIQGRSVWLVGQARVWRDYWFTFAVALVILKVAACLPCSHFGHAWLFNGVLGPAAKLATAVTAGCAAATAPRRRVVWALFAVATACWGAGDLYGQIAQRQDVTAAQVPAFSFSDAVLLFSYVCWYVALVGLAGEGSTRLRSRGWLDGAIAGSGVFAVASAVVLPPVLRSLDGVHVTQAVLAVAYPVADIIVLAMTVVALVGQSLTRDPALRMLVVGLVVLASTDLSYALAVAHNTYRDGDLHDAGWVTGLLLMAIAARLEGRRGQATSNAARSGSPAVWVPLTGTLVASAVIIYGDQRSVPTTAVIAASVAIVLSCTRLAWSLRESSALASARRDARTDVLTDLANRRAAEETVTSLLAADAPCALVLLDVDGFKDVNDSLGHLAGDQLLIQLARRLRTALGPDQFLARMGGDEFVIVSSDPDPGAAQAGATLAAGFVTDALATPFDIDSRSITVTASMGVATSEPGLSFTELFRRSDIAMYEAKRTRAVITRFEDIPVRPDRLNLLHELGEALRRQEFELHYQPLTALQSVPVDGPQTGLQMVEALVRWRHPQRGLVPPAEFIPVLETSDLIVDLTRWVMSTAVSQHVRWLADGLDVRIAVNVSPQVLLRGDIVDMASAALLTSGCRADRLKIEITESAIVDDPEKARVVVGRLRQLGVVISIDDFGTGYTSLRLLRELAADEIKLDRLFVANATHAAADAAIANAVAQLAQRLGIRTVAEGVENVETRSLFRAFGYDYMQGYLDSRPLPAELAGAWLRQHSTDDHRADTLPPVACEPVASLVN